MRNCIPAVVCLSCLLPGSLALAQSEAAPAAGPTIRANVNEVALDVVVRDKHGKFIRALKPGDIEVYEDGVRQEIRGFRMAEGHDVVEQGKTEGAPRPAAGAAMPIPLRSINVVCIVFHNLNPSTRKWAVEAAQEFIRTQSAPDTWIGVFSLDSRLTPLAPFTTNRAELMQAAAHAFAGVGMDLARASDAVLNSTPNLQLYVGFANQTPGGRTGSGGVTDMSTTGGLSTAAITDVSVGTDQGSAAQRGDQVSQRVQFAGLEGRRQMDQIKTLIGGIATLPGHKTVLLFSSGLTGMDEPDVLQSLETNANKSDITFYAFDANGLSETSTAQSSSIAMQHAATLSQQNRTSTPGVNAASSPNTSSMGSAGAVADQIRQDEYTRQAVRTSDTQASLRALSETTGGFMTANSNDMRKPFQRIIGDLDAHYEITYRPSAGKFDGHLRKIEVKVAHADFTVQSRNGYFALPYLGGSPSLTSYEMAGLNVLNSPPPLPHTFDFRTAAFSFRPGDASQSAAVFELPVSSLTATAEADQKRHRLHVSLFALVKDANGQIVDKFSQDAPYEIPDDKLAGLQGTSITWTHPMQLPAGHYTIETALLDREGRRASTGTAEFDSPEKSGLGMSSVILVQRVDPVQGHADAADPFQFATSKVVPDLSGTVNPTAQSYVYFVIYPDPASTEKPQIEVQFLLNGEELAKQDSDLPAPDATGAIPMVVSAVAKAGNCELKITAIQGDKTLARSVTYTVPEQ
jgi:VWFA-related protein